MKEKSGADGYLGLYENGPEQTKGSDWRISRPLSADKYFTIVSHVTLPSTVIFPIVKTRLTEAAMEAAFSSPSLPQAPKIPYVLLQSCLVEESADVVTRPRSTCLRE